MKSSHQVELVKPSEKAEDTVSLFEWVKGRRVVGKPGTRVDGYSHHEREKLVLQVSKKDGLANIKGNGGRGEKGGG
jgi:hypothetical protein